uniref:Uncharacterized protein n=1 Tax=Setaria viridis TaxID=4556 RepID=A0A4V6D7D4_SETVI|nr:hypothetical protein SEVIR_5G364600v2 [Setaria viridis]
MPPPVTKPSSDQRDVCARREPRFPALRFETCVNTAGERRGAVYDQRPQLSHQRISGWFGPTGDWSSGPPPILSGLRRGGWQGRRPSGGGRLAVAEARRRPSSGQWPVAGVSSAAGLGRAGRRGQRWLVGGRRSLWRPGSLGKKKVAIRWKGLAARVRRSATGRVGGGSGGLWPGGAAAAGRGGGGRGGRWSLAGKKRKRWGRRRRLWA